MTNTVYPTLPGLTFNVTKSPTFQTQTQRSVSGIDYRQTLQKYPLYEFSLSYDFLREADAYQELQNLVAFYMTMQGQFGSFLFTDPLDNTAVEQPFGTGDGATVNFQLLRGFGSGGLLFVEPVNNVNALSSIKINGVATTDYVINDSGMVTFATPPSGGTNLTWNGTYYYRCRFVSDSLEFNNFAQKLWEAKNVRFIGSLMSKV